MTAGELSQAEPDGTAARPMVAGRSGNASVWVFGITMAVIAAALFYALEARRSALSSPNVMLPAGSAEGRIASPPALAIPAPYAPQSEFPPVLARRAPPVDDGFRVPQEEESVRPVRTVRRAPPRPAIDDDPGFDDPAPVRRISRPVAEPPPSAPPRPAIARFEPPVIAQPSDPDRKRLTILANPGTTIPKGTVIHAVLESALDSTRPGAVRAIVSRDVSSFDGSRVLIPKGSRLIGNYEADLARGQKRALIQWGRLMLPGGNMMELESPSADPLGRAGVEGKVNSHFFARFGDALMRSVLDTGVQLAGRELGGDTVIVNLPNSGQVVGDNQVAIQPTLKVRHGTSISVFVAHDLDFTERPS